MKRRQRRRKVSKGCRNRLEEEKNTMTQPLAGKPRQMTL